MEISVDNYIDSIPDKRRDLLLMLKEQIIRQAPDCTFTIKYGIIMIYHDKGWVGLGYRKDGVSLYTCGVPALAEYTALHPQIKSGKGCLRFGKNLKSIPEGLDKVINQAFGTDL